MLITACMICHASEWNKTRKSQKSCSKKTAMAHCFRNIFTLCCFSFFFPTANATYLVRRDTNWLIQVSLGVIKRKDNKKTQNHHVQLVLSLFLNPADVLHSQTVPLVHPAKHLSMEVGEQPLFLLKTKHRKVPSVLHKFKTYWRLKRMLF